MDPERTAAETDAADEMEGLYVTVEVAGRVGARLKWVRPNFRQAIHSSGSPGTDRPIIPNRLADPAALYAGLGETPPR